MANDETPKIEPTLVLRDAPSIAADEPRPEAKNEPDELATVEAPKPDSTIADMPIRHSSSITHPWIIAWCPIVTRAPMRAG